MLESGSAHSSAIHIKSFLKSFKLQDRERLSADSECEMCIDSLNIHMMAGEGFFDQRFSLVFVNAHPFMPVSIFSDLDSFAVFRELVQPHPAIQG